MSQHHEIEITLKNGNALPPDPIPELTVGDTVRYFSRDGAVTITFRGASPYRDDDKVNTQVSGGEELTVLQRAGGRFKCGCTITLKNGETVGWNADNPESRSGGEHRVKG